MVLYEFHRGTTPLLVSMPHSGTELPDDLFRRFTPSAKKLPDTDWHIPRLYDFALSLGASVLKAHYSRYVVDLNRPPDNQALYPGQATTELCPKTLFNGDALYQDPEPLGEVEIDDRRERYWRPYHEKLAMELDRIQQEFGHALLYDAHSIASQVPNLFDGRLPDLNLGTAYGQSCAATVEDRIAEVIYSSKFSYAVNGRFVGGYITRYYGRPSAQIHAVQMEIAQSSYMDEVDGFPYRPDKAETLKPVLQRVLSEYLESLD
ncbi:MAG: N-formylglutamate deformylase [Gammaproteobacteria bacterium]|nr:N-formylglutamate deformylase [Gammaproteobacteria bacterium]